MVHHIHEYSSTSATKMWDLLEILPDKIIMTNIPHLSSQNAWWRGFKTISDFLFLELLTQGCHTQGSNLKLPNLGTWLGTDYCMWSFGIGIKIVADLHKHTYLQQNIKAYMILWILASPQIFVCKISTNYPIFKRDIPGHNGWLWPCPHSIFKRQFLPWWILLYLHKLTNEACL